MQANTSLNTEQNFRSVIFVQKPLMIFLTILEKAQVWFILNQKTNIIIHKPIQLLGSTAITINHNHTATKEVQLNLMKPLLKQ